MHLAQLEQGPLDSWLDLGLCLAGDWQTQRGPGGFLLAGGELGELLAVWRWQCWIRFVTGQLELPLGMW